MATRTDITATVPHAPEKVHAALTSNEFWVFLAERMSDPAGSVTGFSASDHTEVTVEQQMGTDSLPDAIRSFAQGGLTVARTISWGPLSEETATATVNAEVNGFPVTFTGTQKLAAEGDGSALATNVDVAVKVPMMGAMLEPKVAEAVKAIYSREADLITEYISTQG